MVPPPEQKASLRRAMVQERLSWAPDSLASASRQIAGHVSQLLPDNCDVALYWPLLERGEVDLRSLAEQAPARGWRLHFPYMADSAPPSFRRVEVLEELQAHRYGFLQPRPTHALSLALDWIVLPALAVSLSGHRLGYGAGFYDRALARYCPPAQSVAVVLDAQVQDVPREPHDQPCQWVVTESRIVRTADV